MGAVKVATCCYCGTKAALVLKGESRHELACGSCGAPLHRLKMLPNAPRGTTAPAATPARPTPKMDRSHGVKPAGWGRKKKKKRKGLGAKVFEELWDVVEDIFD